MADQEIIIEPLHLPGVEIKFEALEMEIQRQYSSKYNAEEVYGKMDPIVTFQNVTRTLAVSFAVQTVGGRPTEVTELANKVNLLVTSLYPTYTAAAPGSPSIIKAPPFFRIQYGSMLGAFGDGSERKGLSGYISNLDIGTMKTSENNEDMGGRRRVPGKYSIRFNFAPIHERKMGWYQGEFAGGPSLEIGSIANRAAGLVLELIQATEAENNIEEVENNRTGTGAQRGSWVDGILNGE